MATQETPAKFITIKKQTMKVNIKSKKYILPAFVFLFLVGVIASFMLLLMNFVPSKADTENRAPIVEAKKTDKQEVERPPPLSEEPWNILCDSEKNSCRAYGQITTEENLVASSLSFQEVKISDDAPPQMVGVIMLPLGLHIPSGVTVKIDEKMTFKADLLECKQRGCRAYFLAQEDVITLLKDGNILSIAIVDSNSQNELELTYSLDGFTKTYEQLIALN